MNKDFYQSFIFLGAIVFALVILKIIDSSNGFFTHLADGVYQWLLVR